MHLQFPQQRQVKRYQTILGFYRELRQGVPNSGAYFTIEQFAQYRINQVSAKTGENTFDYSSTSHNTFDSTEDTFDSQSIFIPPGIQYKNQYPAAG